MSVEYTVLGVLMDEPTHGYSIKKHLLDSFSKDLGLNDGQLYPALARLERRGWITKQVVEQQRSPTKHLYRVTSEGEDAFLAWLESGSPDSEPVRADFFWRFEFLQRCSFFRHLEADTVIDQTRCSIEVVDAQIAKLEAFLKRMEQKEADPYRQMVVEYGIRSQRMRREWLEDLMGRVQDSNARAAARA